jgi:protein TonB
MPATQPISSSPPSLIEEARAPVPAFGASTRTRAGVLSLVLALHVAALAALLVAKPAPEAPAIRPPMMVSLVAPLAPESDPAPKPAAQFPSRTVAKTAPSVSPSARPAPRPLQRPAIQEAAAEASITAPADLSPAPAAPSAAPPSAPAAQVETAAPAPAPPTPARYDAAYLHNETPYPPLARRLRETGTVQLRVLVSAEGLAEKIELLASSGSPRLDESAQAAVRRWRFIPARQGDHAVASHVVVPIIYKLEES